MPFCGQKVNLVRPSTEAKSFSLLMQPSLFIFCLRQPLALAVKQAASLRRYYTKTHSTSPVNLHSLVPLLGLASIT